MSYVTSYSINHCCKLKLTCHWTTLPKYQAVEVKTWAFEIDWHAHSENNLKMSSISSLQLWCSTVCWIFAMPASRQVVRQCHLVNHWLLAICKGSIAWRLVKHKSSVSNILAYLFDRRYALLQHAALTKPVFAMKSPLCKLWSCWQSYPRESLPGICRSWLKIQRVPLVAALRMCCPFWRSWRRPNHHRFQWHSIQFTSLFSQTVWKCSGAGRHAHNVTCFLEATVRRSQVFRGWPRRAGSTHSEELRIIRQLYYFKSTPRAYH